MFSHFTIFKLYDKCSFTFSGKKTIKLYKHNLSKRFSGFQHKLYLFLLLGSCIMLAHLTSKNNRVSESEIHLMRRKYMYPFF